MGEALQLAEADLREALAEGAPAVVVTAARARVLELQATLRAQTATAPSTGRWEPLALHPAPEARALRSAAEPHDAETPSIRPADPEDEFRRRVESAVAMTWRRRRRRTKPLRALAGAAARLPHGARLLAAAFVSVRGGRYHEHFARLTGTPDRPPAPPDAPEPIDLTVADAGAERPCIDGLSPTARLVVEALHRRTAPEERMSFQALSRALIEDHPALTPSLVAHTVDLLTRQAWRLLDQQRHDNTTSLTQLGRDFLDGRVSVPMLLLNGVETADVFFPPLVATGVIDAALGRLAADHVAHASLCPRPSYRAGLSRDAAAERALWSTGQGELTITASLVAPRDENLPLVRVESFPRTDLIPEFLRRFDARRQRGEFDGVKAVRREGDHVLLELDHPLFVSCTLDELDRSGIVAWRHVARLEVSAPTGVVTMSVAEVINRFVDTELARLAGTSEDHTTLVRAAVEAETLVVALQLLEPVLLAMRPSLDDREAVEALMHFMRPEYRAVIDALPYQPSHPYTEGFTEAQARRLVAHRKLRARSLDFAMQDWATAMEALAKRAQARAEASSRLREALSVARLRLFRRERERCWFEQCVVATPARAGRS